jgi:hypothetical protein
MLYSEIIAGCSEIHTKHINTLCGQNVELLNVKRGGTYSDHCALKHERDAIFHKPPHIAQISLLHSQSIWRSEQRHTDH